ncbi:MAG: S9 family peptidase [Bdellovibrionales bacterium]|nr:S9 family peptidase [Bdellovibrionales bacterium]
MQPPKAKKQPHSIQQHGQVRVDNYHWLRDENWREITAGKINFKNPEILEYLEQENAYADYMMYDTKNLQQELYDDILSHTKEDDESYPLKFGPYLYYQRTETGKDYPILCRKKIEELEGREEVYFDVNIEAEPHDLYMMGSQSISPNHRFLAYSYNLSGSLSYTLRIRDTKTGKDFPWEVPNVEGSIIWAPDSQHFYYSLRHPEVGRTYQVYQVNIAKGVESKTLVFEKPNEHADKFMGLSKSKSGEFLFINLADSKTSSTYFWNASDTSHVVPKLFTEVQEGHLYSVEHHDDLFYIHSNLNGATNFQVLTTPIGATDVSNWITLIAESLTTYIDAIYLYRDTLVLSIQDNQKALPGFIIHDLQTQSEYPVAMPQEAYDLQFVGARDFETEELRFYYESPTQPSQTIDFNIKTRQQMVRKTKEVPKYDASLYEVHRHFVKAADGAEVPLTLSYKKGLKRDGNNKTLIIGYGSYGFSYPCYFSPKWIPLWNRGFIIAIAHIRGGSDKGYQWYLDGKMRHKKNSFTDFNRCAEFLIENDYTSSDKLAANGGSAGGLLMGAIMNMRPDLYRVIVADVAFVDVISTISDPSLPLTPPEWEEWGNPIESADDFSYIMSYSPYDNVKAQSYPTTLFISGVSDEQVTYWEPTKMVAKLRELKTDSNPLLLKMKMSSGHAGASKRYEAIEEAAFRFAFIVKHLS